jgi:hypothetical protein
LRVPRESELSTTKRAAGECARIARTPVFLPFPLIMTWRQFDLSLSSQQ